MMLLYSKDLFDMMLKWMTHNRHKEKVSTLCHVFILINAILDASGFEEIVSYVPYVVSHFVISIICKCYHWYWLVLVNLLVICRQATHEICGEPSTQCSSGQPQCSAHGQRLGEHYPRFPCRSILQCWMIAV